MTGPELPVIVPEEGTTPPDVPVDIPFQEVLVATTGNDVLVGGDTNTEFLMEQGTGPDAVPSGTLGGDDTVED